MYRTEKTAILMATYNGENFIRDQIDSILAQTDTDWMLYIHDDGSKDKTRSIIKQYENQYPECIQIIEGEPTGGAKENFFYLMNQVEAPYYMFADQDDVWRMEKVQLTKAEMLKMESKESKETPCLVFTELKVVNSSLGVLADSMSEYQGLDCQNLTFNRALIQNVVTGCTMMVNKSLRDKMLEVENYEDILMHDWWAFLVATRFGKVSFLAFQTIQYRQHANNGVGARDAKSPLYLMKRMLQGEAIKESLVNTRKQAAKFVKEYKEVEDSLASQYAKLGEKERKERLKFYKENDVKKSTFARNVGLWIWG